MSKMEVKKEGRGFSLKVYEPEDEELEKINQYTRRPLAKEEVYTFSLTLCDNEVDRDYEVFSLKSLENLRKLFTGKTVKSDHETKSSNQTARIYDTELEFNEGDEKNAAGERKASLKARAYIPVTEFTRDVISRIDGGILKEVSVGCSVKKSRCNICGKEHCSHVKGHIYGGVTCVKILDEADDAYEVSFVAVPAQRNAGVNKKYGFTNEDNDLTEKLMDLREGRDIILSYSEAKELKRAAMWGESYRKSLIDSVKRASCILAPRLDAGIMEEMAMALDMEKLISLNKYYEDELENKLPLKSQLAGEFARRKDDDRNQGNEFMI